MSYRLSLDQPVPDALRAAAAERLDHAAELLRAHSEADPVKAVHGVRKDLKKTRSILRLARPDLSPKVYRRENRLLRDTARSISAARDADVLAETVDKLSERFAGQLPKQAFTTLRRRLAAAAAQGRDGAEGSRGGEAVDALEAAAARVAGWPLHRSDQDTLRAGAVRAYERGRRALAAVEADPSTERLHEWRKRVKDLWYHQRLLREAWPGPLKAQASESDALSELLGDDHDLAALADALGAEPAPTRGTTVDVDAVRELIAQRRTELQAAAIDLGRRIYAEKPSAYGRRLAGYLAASGAGTQEPQPA
jgi:CHAD domain-containing protein